MNDVSSSARNRHQFRPAVESLVERIVPTLTITQRGTTVIVQGDDRNNAVIIKDSGGIQTGSVVIEADFQSLVTVGPVQTIKVFTGNGDDQVLYNLTDNLTGTFTRKVHIDLGAGTIDRFRGDLEGGTLKGSGLDLRVLGGLGIDQMQVDSSAGVNTSAGSSLKVNLNGGADADRISINYVGLVDGTSNFIADGGDWYDRIRMKLEIGNSTGVVKAAGIGGNDNDFIDLFVRFASEGSTPSHSLKIVGGPGTDTGRRTLFVVPIEIEDDRLTRR